MALTMPKSAQADVGCGSILKGPPTLNQRTMSMLAHPGLMQMSQDAKAAFERGDHRTAEELSRRVLGLDMEDAVGLEVLASVFARTGRAEEALKLQQAVLNHFRNKQLRNSMTFGLHLLHERGYRARGIRDIGAYNGGFAR